MRVMAHRTFLLAVATVPRRWPRLRPPRGRSSRSAARTPRRACPAAPCLAVSRTTGYQIKVGDERNSFTVPEDGKIVAWSINLGKPTAEQIDYFDKNLGGQASARLTVLRLGRRSTRARSRRVRCRSSSRTSGRRCSSRSAGRSTSRRVMSCADSSDLGARADTAADGPQLVARVAGQGQVQRHRAADRPAVTGPRHAVPLPLQGAAHLQRDARHPPGTHP